MVQGSWAWFAVAALLAGLSMLAFGGMRQRTIRAAGSAIDLRGAVAVSYGAGAIHMTAPVGTVPAAAYAFRELRRRGADSAAIAWSLTVTGVLSTATLVALGAGGIAVGAVGGAWTELISAGLGGVGVAFALLALATHLTRLTPWVERVLRRVNRLLRRPPESGVVTVRMTLHDLAAVRPRRTDVAAGAVLALANWLLDLGCLWACANAMGVTVSPWALVAGYALAMLGSGASPLPGGIGVVDSVLAVTLVSAGGVTVGAALGAVIVYRLLSLGSLVVVGWGLIGRQALRRHGARRSRVAAGVERAVARP